MAAASFQRQAPRQALVSSMQQQLRHAPHAANASPYATPLRAFNSDPRGAPGRAAAGTSDRVGHAVAQAGGRHAEGGGFFGAFGRRPPLFAPAHHQQQQHAAHAGPKPVRGRGPFRFECKWTRRSVPGLTSRDRQTGLCRAQSGLGLHAPLLDRDWVWGAGMGLGTDWDCFPSCHTQAQTQDSAAQGLLLSCSAFITAGAVLAGTPSRICKCRVSATPLGKQFQCIHLPT
jgi:hypothetical protein